MIPLKDDIPSRTFPVVTVLLIVLNVVVFLADLASGHALSVTSASRLAGSARDYFEPPKMTQSSRFQKTSIVVKPASRSHTSCGSSGSM